MENTLSNSIKCHICYLYYSSERLPLVFMCGHTVCSCCLSKIYEGDNLICPFDKKSLQYENIQSVPINFSLIEIIQSLINISVVTECNFEPLPSRNYDAIQMITFERIGRVRNILEFIKNDFKNFAEIEKVYNEFKLKFKNKTEKKQIKRFYDDGGFYIGELESEKKNGRGIYFNRKSKILYEGFFLDNAKHGQGIEMNLTKSTVYLGTFLNNIKEGEGYFFYKNGANYEGQIFQNKKHGNGKETFANGNTYQGKYENNKIVGKGEFTFILSGNIHKGNFVNGKLEGKGKEITKHHKYKGEFRDGAKNGYGIIVYQNGTMYKGDFMDGKFNGKGTIRYHNSVLYEGEFQEGIENGFGKVIFPSGNIYEGNFINGNFEGKGTLEIPGNYKYEGNFMKGRKWNDGMIIYQNGDKFKGEFMNDMKNGKGVLEIKNGLKIEGEWMNNKLIKGVYIENNKIVKSFDYSKESEKLELDDRISDEN
jgi:hypothetical protein